LSSARALQKSANHPFERSQNKRKSGLAALPAFLDRSAMLRGAAAALTGHRHPFLVRVRLGFNEKSSFVDFEIFLKNGLLFGVATATRRGKRRGKRREKEKKKRRKREKIAPAGRVDPQIRRPQGTKTLKNPVF
jgi:hypothetical protein